MNKRLIAIIIGFLVVAGGMFGAGYFTGAKYGGNDSTAKEENTATTESSLVTQTEDNTIITLSTTVLTAAEATSVDATADGIVAITATAENSAGTADSTINWASSNSIVTVCNESSEPITQSESGDIVYAICSGAFSTQVTITATAASNASAVATVYCDYAARLNSSAEVKTDIMEDQGSDFNNYVTKEGTTCTWVMCDTGSIYLYDDYISDQEVSVGYNSANTVGTIFDTYTIYSIYLSTTDSVTSYGMVSSHFGLIAEPDENYPIGEQEYVGTMYAIDDMFYACLTESTDDASKYLSALSEMYNDGVPAVTATVTLKSDTYGFVYTYTCDILVDVSQFITATSVSTNITNVVY